jgi:hypothetical protein
MDSRVCNGGSPVKGGKFWTNVTTAFLEVRDLNGNINEKVGIPPDQEVHADWDQFLNAGKDNVLDAGIEYIKSR